MIKGNLIWSYRKQRAKFVEDKNGKFQIIDGQIEPIIKEKIKKVMVIEEDVVYRNRDRDSSRGMLAAMGMP